MTASTGRPFATQQKEQFSPSLSSLSAIVVPIDQRKWKDILAVEYVDERSLSFNVSKSLTRILRHRGLREIFVLQCLEVTDPNTTTSRSSSRNRWSNGIEHIVTYVMSLSFESPKMDESDVNRLSAERKQKGKISVLPEL